MSVLTLEGRVENGQIRLLEPSSLRENQRVFVVVPDVASGPPGIWSPRLANPAQATEFKLEVTELVGGEPHAKV